MYNDATIEEIDTALQSSWQAFEAYRQLNLKQRADFLRTIAKELEVLSDTVVQTAHQETNLPDKRLLGELQRTIFQLTSYAQACEVGAWLDIRIDTADPNNAAKQDIRKLLIPLGPVVVFGASNFPFAYSTAGGDTACALAAGCPVLIKAHPAHAETSEAVANAIKKAAEKCGLPSGIFHHIHGRSFEVGKALVEHPLTKAVGFTGSVEGGRALFDIANGRQVPIPVFAEMGSVNPVFILPQKLKEDTAHIADMYAASITESAGQFCTNPGIMVAIEDGALNNFVELLSAKIKQVHPVKMLHTGIAKGFHTKRKEALSQQNVAVIAQTNDEAAEDESIPTIAQTTAAAFLQNPLLHKEVFGPYSLLVVCKNQDELLQVAQYMEGQLTATLIATLQEAKEHISLVHALHHICGRLVFNSVPTGVRVCLAMQHGGPYPATTDSRFTAVGADGIKRFARPICYQNWMSELLPDELKNENPLRLWRTVNDVLTKEAIV